MRFRVCRAGAKPCRRPVPAQAARSDNPARAGLQPGAPRSMRCVRVALICLYAVVFPATAADTAAPSTPRSWFPSHVFAQAAWGDHSDALTAGLLWSWHDPRRAVTGGTWSGYTELSLGRWRARDGNGGDALSAHAGLAPLLRYHFERWPKLFVEGAIGANVIAPVYRNGDKRFSTVFNFGEHLGFGFRSADGALELTLRYQHFSNVGFRKPNPGENFVQLRLSSLL
jgi:hypothetical protein